MLSSGCERSIGSAAVIVEAPARLHLGFLDPGASLGRRFGSLGLVIDGIATVVTLARETGLKRNVVEADDVNIRRIADHLATLQCETGRDEPLRVQLHQSSAVHAGFGSGTQLALAVGRGFAALHGLTPSTQSLAALLGRGERSGIGVAAFDEGGLLLDAGRTASGAPAPLIARLAIPEKWRVVLVMDPHMVGLCGEAERAAMSNLPPFPQQLAASLCHEVLMQVLPGALEHDIKAFAHGVNEIQNTIGSYFAPHQNDSMYTSPRVQRALEWIAGETTAAIGQSSWGPTGFAIVATEDEALRVLAAARAAGRLDPGLITRIVAGRNHGAAVRRMGTNRVLTPVESSRTGSARPPWSARRSSRSSRYF
jgi:beta-RFAP synthase